MNRASIKENPTNRDEKSYKIPITSDYTLEDPINISSPSDWGLYPFITGNGSELNPYIIENIEIQGGGIKTVEQYGHNKLNYSDKGIYINAEGNFTIRNCKISSISFGIFLGLGVSTGYTHNIDGVEINNCGIGIDIWWLGIAVNISKCNISNCNWVTVIAPYDFESKAYGGIGIYINGGGDGSIVEFCRIQNCSIGLSASHTVSLIKNQLINCGFLFDSGYISSISLVNNTVNGKPLGLFFNMDNLIISGQQASQYGQLIFILCHNLHLFNVDITEPCSFGLLIENCHNAMLENIICENQKIGFFIHRFEIKADNLYAKNCDTGFYLSEIYDCTLTKLLTNNTDIPIYLNTPIRDSTIELEKSIRCYIIDNYIICDELHVNSSVSSFSVFKSFLTEFDNDGFLIQLNDAQTYQVVDTLPEMWVNFTIVIFERYEPSVIPGFPLFWFFTAILVGIFYLKFLYRWKKR